jgi:Big-like domain-containing protein
MIRRFNAPWLCLTLSLVALSDARAQESKKPPLPLEVYFSSPIQDEADVRLDVIVRIQFSRDVDRATLVDRVRMSYTASDSADRGEAQPPDVAFAMKYLADSRAIEIVPTRPLERFRNVTVELLDGIAGTDGSVLKKWSLTFSTGGS